MCPRLCGERKTFVEGVQRDDLHFEVTIECHLTKDAIAESGLARS